MNAGDTQNRCLGTRTGTDASADDAEMALAVELWFVTDCFPTRSPQPFSPLPLEPKLIRDRRASAVSLDIFDRSAPLSCL